nr:hypothetical protein MACL_00001086 [Theileria orientalis]
MDSGENTLNENDLVPEAPPSELNNFISTDENSSDLKESPEIDYSKIQDIEFGSKVLLFFDYFTHLKEFFQLSTSEYFDRCFAALYPYFCINLSFSALFNHLKSFVYTRRLWFPDSLTSFAESANAARRGSDDTINVNLDVSNEESEVNVHFDKDTENVFDISASSSYFKGIQLKQQSKWYRTLCSMTQFPDLYGPIWINITASSSLFFSSCISHKLHSLNSLLTLSCFYELVFTYFYLFISTSFTLSIALPSLDSRKRTFLYKLAAIISSYVTQSLFLTLIQKYIH